VREQHRESHGCLARPVVLREPPGLQELVDVPVEGELAPGESFETCTLFLVPKGREPSKVSFLPNDPGAETDFVYWDVS